MEPRDPIPDWLGISWWWLLIIGAVEAEVRHLLHIPYSQFSISSDVWQFGQAWWLRKASGTGLPLYLFVGASIYTLIDEGFHLSARLVESLHLAIIVIGTVTAFIPTILWIAAIVIFVRALRGYLARTEGSEPLVSYVWAILFNVLYFQYKFHDLYQDQKSESLRFTP